MTINLGRTQRWGKRPVGAVDRAAAALAKRGKADPTIRDAEDWHYRKDTIPAVPVGKQGGHEPNLADDRIAQPWIPK